MHFTPKISKDKVNSFYYPLLPNIFLTLRNCFLYWNMERISNLKHEMPFVSIRKIYHNHPMKPILGSSSSLTLIVTQSARIDDSASLTSLYFSYLPPSNCHHKSLLTILIFNIFTILQPK